MRRRTAYSLSKLNGSTYLIIHDDKYTQFPYIYVKLYNSPCLAVIIDTGCGAHNGRECGVLSELKDFIDRHILRLSETEHESNHEYMVICTHCHFDHIGGIEAFARAGASILASGFDRDFLRPENRRRNSFSEAFGTKMPQYEITHFVNDGEWLQHHGVDLRLQALHTPGHTPDSVAIYDEQERWLFIGDTFYNRIAQMPWGKRQDLPIFFPPQGNWKDYMASLKKILDFANFEDEKVAQEQELERVRIAAGHTTSDAFAAELAGEVVEFSRAIMNGEVPIVAELPGDEVAPGGSLGEEMFIFWQADGEPKFSLIAPASFQREFHTLMHL